MTTANIINYRLVNQQIAGTHFTKPGEIVGWLGAMQSQEFAMAKWAIGLRVPGLNDTDVEQAFNQGTILRTHLLRPTWHFVTPADIRWILALTAPRVNSFNSSLYRKLGLDDKIFNRSKNIFTKALEGTQLTRDALKQALRQKKINTDDLRFVCLLMHAELAGIICSGARTGKQFTYALLEERVPPTIKMSPGEALSELARRYFTSRGPATIQDFVWWSGLTVKDAKTGIASLEKKFLHEHIDGREYIFLPANSTGNNKLQTTFLMPDYDEYGISYKNRDALFNTGSRAGETGRNAVFNHLIVIDGVFGGTWQKTISKNGIAVQTTMYTTVSKAKHKALLNAEKKFLAFVNG